MGIVIRKKPKFQKKKVIKRIIILLCVYIVTFIFSFSFLSKSHKPKTPVPQGTAIVYANDGEKFLAEQKYAQAVEYYLSQINKNPEDFLSMTKLGLAYKNLAQYDKAKFYLYKSYEISPTYVENYVLATQIYILQKKYDVAENTIDAIPTTKKEDFIAKGNLLIQLADEMQDLEDKIVFYRRALSYYKKYDIATYNKTINDLINLYFQLADFYIQKGDIESVKSLYMSIPKYRDDCLTRNALALKYKGISDADVVINITQAVNHAQSQEEKRLTRKNLIDLKYYFAEKGSNTNVKNLNILLSVLDEGTILVDEKFMPFAITNETFKYVSDKKNKTILPVLSFKIKNKSNKPVSSVYVKAEIYFHHKKILETKKECAVPHDVLLFPAKETNLITVNFENEVKKNKLEYYTVGLSLSDDNMNWKLFRIYKSDAIEH